MSATARPDLRQYPRRTQSLLVQYRTDLLSAYRIEYATDVSAGGLFVRTDEPRAAGTLLQIQLTPRDGSRAIEGLGRVVRSVLAGVDLERGAAGMGIEFVDLDPDSIAALQPQA